MTFTIRTKVKETLKKQKQEIKENRDGMGLHQLFERLTMSLDINLQ
jgi:hypothetical protein